MAGTDQNHNILVFFHYFVENLKMKQRANFYIKIREGEPPKIVNLFFTP